MTTHLAAPRRARMRRASRAAVALASLLLAPTAAAAAAAQSSPPAERCTAADGDARALLTRALQATGMDRAAGRVLHLRAIDVEANDFQSDRTYPPYLATMTSSELWLDAASGVRRAATALTYPGQGPMPAVTTLASARATYLLRDTLVPAPPVHAATQRTRPLAAWLVLHDWAAAPDVRVVGRCDYRDFPRLVLERATTGGVERLYLDPESALPVKLDRREPHYLWGDVRVEYVWSNWDRADDVLVPLSSFRLVDGATLVTRTVGDVALVSPDSAPSLALPADAPAMPVTQAAFVQPLPTDTVRIGAHAFLLHNRYYTSAVVLARDTVWVLDATQGVERARQDSAWIGRLFPGPHPVAVVVTDLAWPHVAGVRYWVGAGATVISHRASEPFLRAVVERRWTLAPDLRERRRAAAPFRFRAVDDSLALGGGALRLHTIGGIGSEGALMVYLPAERFLYAGDFVQTAKRPAQYTAEVIAAVHRAGLAPERLAAMHLPVTPWGAIEALMR
ncbi:MAG TPA: hypothetical protein VFS08_06745 [Gemmatimonadaceae bacterium]|nr:hypothetical protein [Gemmatimonadaceae bacterium]